MAEAEHSSDVADSERKWSLGENSVLFPLRFLGGRTIPNNQETPLHIAILQGRIDVAVNLIRQGADVNATNMLGLTPLHCAIWNGIYPAVCMLLYYNANVRTVTFKEATPWEMAVAGGELEVASLLINYYSADEAVLMLAKCVSAHSPDVYRKLFVDAIEAGGDVTCEDEYGNSPLIMSLTWLDSDLFKLMWSKFNSMVVVDRYPFFLFEYITECDFAPSEWLECLYLILESDVALKLAQTDNKLQSQREFGVKSYLIYELVVACQNKAIDRVHLVELIYTLLNFGTRVNSRAVELVHLYYGFGAELEAFLNCANYCGSLHDFRFHIPRFLIAVKDDLSREEVPMLLSGRFSRNLGGFMCQYMLYYNNVGSMLGFFALPKYLKRELFTVACDRAQKEKQLRHVPDVPSLVELSRNQARVFITQVNKVKQVHQFYDALRRLNYPQLLKDVICLKEPIYYVEPESTLKVSRMFV